MSDPLVTIGFCPRERFAMAPESLARILKHTTVSHHLVVVDCNTPRTIWHKLEKQLLGHQNVTIITRDEYLLPSACKNIIIEHTNTEFLCLIENDILVEKGWIENFLSSSRTHAADVVVPLIFEVFEDRPDRPPRPHFDDDLGSVVTTETDAGEKLDIRPRESSRFDDPGSAARPVDFMEAHCLFFRSELFDLMQPFDGECSASDEVDISMAVRTAGATTVFDPSCTVTFTQPAYPVIEVDRDYFLMRWDPRKAEQSHHRLMKRWRLAHSPQLLGFWHERFARGGNTLGDWRDELAKLSGGYPVILVDGQQFRGAELDQNLETIPFTENMGEYWGDPADDESAIRELGKGIVAGAA